MEIYRSNSESGNRQKGLCFRRRQSLRKRFGGDVTSPMGWVSVRVGPVKERFMVRVEWMNHRLFQRLLDDAEEEFGFATKGSLKLPCSVEVFSSVLSEIERLEVDSAAAASAVLCGFATAPARGNEKGKSFA